jgi:hypothetical protein
MFTPCAEKKSAQDFKTMLVFLINHSILSYENNSTPLEYGHCFGLLDPAAQKWVCKQQQSR